MTQKKRFFKKSFNLQFSKFLGVNKICFVKETKDLYFNPLYKIKWVPNKRSASDFAFNSY